MKIHDFIKEHEENENKITSLTEEILFLKGIDTVSLGSGFLTTELLPKIIRSRFILKFERLRGELRLTKEDVNALIEIRMNQQEPLFEKRKELEKLIRGENDENKWNMVEKWESKMKTEYAQYVQKVEDAKKYEKAIEEYDVELLKELLYNYKCELNYMQKQLYANMYGFDEEW